MNFVFWLLALSLSRFSWRIWKMHFNVNVTGESPGVGCPFGGAWTKPFSSSQSVALHGLLKHNFTQDSSLCFFSDSRQFLLCFIMSQCSASWCANLDITHTLFLVLNSRDYLVHKRPHQTIVFWFNLKMAGLRILRLWCVTDAVIAWTWWNSNLTRWNFAIVRSNCELTPILCTPEVTIFSSRWGLKTLWVLW